MSDNDAAAAAPSSIDEPLPKKSRLMEDTVKLPTELSSVDFTRRITWGKYLPYPAALDDDSTQNDDTEAQRSIPLTPIGTPPAFDPKTSSAALCFHVHGISGRARACSLHFPPRTADSSRTPVPTPIFMPVGTKGCLKSLTVEELVSDPALQCPILLGNTYHLALQPGTDLLDTIGGLHEFMGLPPAKSSLLTDSGGFQMVSLVKLCQITEEGVNFESPFEKGRMMLLRPEDSIRYQNEIGADIIMALDDVVSSVIDDQTRFTVATYRTLRWYDRCRAAHSKPQQQNLFPIVQGGLDTSMGGLREHCLAGFRNRDEHVPGYAIGGLAGGESKDHFWRVVDQCCQALPDTKPRYLMGVGYPLDLVVCTALGVDMYDCVYPTRTARFGVALVKGPSPGTLRLKHHECAFDTNIIQEGCGCQACSRGVSRARLHALLKTGNPLAIQLLTQHNLAYMMALVRSMRQSILEDRFADYARSFVRQQFIGAASGGEDVPTWVKEALTAAGIKLEMDE